MRLSKNSVQMFNYILLATLQLTPVDSTTVPMPEVFQAFRFSEMYINVFSEVVDNMDTKRILPSVAASPSKCLQSYLQ